MECESTKTLTFLKQYVELGISTVDNAAIYGDSEQFFGEALALDPAIREQIKTVSKFGINGTPDAIGEKRVSHCDSSCSFILSSSENSLKRFGVGQF